MRFFFKDDFVLAMFRWRLGMSEPIQLKSVTFAFCQAFLLFSRTMDSILDTSLAYDLSTAKSI